MKFRIALIFIVAMVNFINASPPFKPMIGLNVSRIDWVGVYTNKGDFLGLHEVGLSSGAYVDGGIPLQFNINIALGNYKKMIFETGIGYSSRFDFDGHTWFDGLFLYRMNYLSIPFRTTFTLGKKKLKFIPSAGFSVDYLIKGIVEFYSDNQEFLRKESINLDRRRKIGLCPFISLGMGYQFKNEMSIRTEFVIHQSILSTYKKWASNYLAHYMHGFGLNVGVYFPLPQRK